MPDKCEDCLEIKKIEFQIKGLELSNHKQELSIETIHEAQESRDIEHEQMIQNLATRMDNMTQDLADFKKDVKNDIQMVKTDMSKEIQSVKDDIPKLFEASINKLLAKIAKYLLTGLFIILAVIALAFTRPLIVKGLNELTHWVETVEVKK